MLKTNRLILKNITINDSKSLFNLAKNPVIGLNCGWKPHKDINESIYIINNVINDKDDYGIYLLDQTLIGMISIKKNGKTELTNKIDECELGYWLGVDYWHNGYMAEAINKIIDYAFNILKMKIIYCSYYEGNINSKKVIENAGFIYERTINNYFVKLIDEYKNVIIYKKINKNLVKKIRKKA